MAVVAITYTPTPDGDYVIRSDVQYPPPYPTDGKPYKWDEDYRYWKPLTHYSNDAFICDNYWYPPDGKVK